MSRRNRPNKFITVLYMISILILINWINNLYDDIDDRDFKIEVSCIRDSSMVLQNIEKNRIIDSLKNLNKKEEPVIKPKYKKVYSDTIKPIQDTFKVLTIDTIKPITDTTNL